MSNRTCLTLCITTLGLSAVQQAVAQDDEVIDRTPAECISLNRIRRTEVVDDRSILFYASGGRVYLNVLERDCPGLERNDRFMYKVVGSRLCDIDTITVLERFGGNFERGFTCRLGEFNPLSKIEAEDLLLDSDEVSESGAIEIKPVELPKEDAADEAE